MNSSYYNGFYKNFQGIVIRKSLKFCYNKTINYVKKRKHNETHFMEYRLA